MRCLGVLPFLRDVGVDDEDSVSLDASTAASARLPVAADGWPVGAGPRVAVVRLPYVSNFTDFRPLEECGLFRMRWVDRPEESAGADLVVIPGTKSCVGDLAALRERGFEPMFRRLRAAGSRFLGVCGGYQMLGERILDPDGVESPTPEVRGLGMLPVVTTFAGDKVTEVVRVRGSGAGWFDREVAIIGYEIHMGRSEGTCRPAFTTVPDGRAEGSVSDDGLVIGSYVHGLFDDFAAIGALARTMGVSSERIDAAREAWDGRAAAKEAAYDRLAAVLREHLDMAAINALVDEGNESKRMGG